MELKTVPVSDIRPYAKNPRINDQAVESVAESIKQCGYIAPSVVDENMEILAGHTRYKALLRLGITNAQVAVASGLSNAQKRKYRVLDNKTAEIAVWDLPILEKELDSLDFGEFDFGFSRDLEIEQETLDEFFADARTETDSARKKHICPKCGCEF